MSKLPHRTRQALALLAIGDREENQQEQTGTTFLNPEEMARRADIFERTGYGAMIKFFGEQVLPWAIDKLISSKLKGLPQSWQDKIIRYVRMVEYVAQKYATNTSRQLSDATLVVMSDEALRRKSPEAADWFEGLKRYLPGYVIEGDVVGTIQQIQFSLNLTDGMSYADKVFLLGWTYYCLGVAPDKVWLELGLESNQLDVVRAAVESELKKEYGKAPEEILSAPTRISVFGGPGILEQTFGPPRNAAEREAYDVLYGTYGDRGLMEIIGLFKLVYDRRAKGG